MRHANPAARSDEPLSSQVRALLLDASDILSFGSQLALGLQRLIRQQRSVCQRRDDQIDQMRQMRDELLAGEPMLQPAAALMDRDAERLQRLQRTDLRNLSQLHQRSAQPQTPDCTRRSAQFSQMARRLLAIELLRVGYGSLCVARRSVSAMDPHLLELAEGAHTDKYAQWHKRSDDWQQRAASAMRQLLLQSHVTAQQIHRQSLIYHALLAGGGVGQLSPLLSIAPGADIKQTPTSDPWDAAAESGHDCACEIHAAAASVSSSASGSASSSASASSSVSSSSSADTLRVTDSRLLPWPSVLSVLAADETRIDDVRSVLQLIAMGLDPTEPDPQLLLSPLQTARKHAREFGASQLQSRSLSQLEGSARRHTKSSPVDAFQADAEAAATGSDASLDRTERKSSRETIRLQSVCPPPPGSIQGRMAVRRSQFQQRHDFLTKLLRLWRHHSGRVISLLHLSAIFDSDGERVVSQYLDLDPCASLA